MSNDPRSDLRTILLGVTATEDDDATPATILVMYQGGPETFDYLFNTLTNDAVITIGRFSEQSSTMQTKSIQGVPLRYNKSIPFHVTSQDSATVTATKLLEKIRKSIISVIEADPLKPDFTIFLSNDEGRNIRMGGLDPLWSDMYGAAYRPVEG